MKLSFKISLVIGALSVVISTVVAGLSFTFQLEQATEQSEHLVKQLVQSANRTSAIAAYLDDTELANEIVIGLANNDLIASATIETVSAAPAIVAGKIDKNLPAIRLPLYNPFIETEIVGLLIVYPNADFIEKQASASSLRTAYLLVAVNICIAIIVGLYVRKKLTHPLRNLSNQFGFIDTSTPDKMQTIDIDYNKNDEIGNLVTKVNSLIDALKGQFLSEKLLRKTTEELQKRFRLLFEQATAGIGLLDNQGMITIANPAFNELFGGNTEGKTLSSYLADPSDFEDQIERLFTVDSNAQIEIDLVAYKGTQKCYLHCLLSTINESRDEIRKLSQDLRQHLIEVIIYDVTNRREQEIKARYEADHDSLTGLLNRRAGTQSLMHQLDKIDSDMPYFALMMIDLDKFKPVNDTHGHDVGDIVLEKVSERMRKSLVSVDATCIRWGGDEFLLGLSCISKEEVEEYTRILLIAIKRELAIEPSLRLSVGASIGVILLANSNKRPVHIDTLIAQADSLMYDTKQNKDKLAENFLIIDYVEDY